MLNKHKVKAMVPSGWRMTRHRTATHRSTGDVSTLIILKKEGETIGFLFRKTTNRRMIEGGFHSETMNPVAETVFNQLWRSLVETQRIRDMIGDRPYRFELIDIADSEKWQQL
jgi:hypothetical protein